MLLIRPLDITPAMVTASNAGSADPAYNPATSYSLGQRVYLADDGRTYECVQAPALGQYPPSSPLYWMPAAPSNRWAMWDTEISTASTTSGGTLTATVQPGARFNSVTFHGLVGSEITVVQKSSTGDTLWSETRSLRTDSAGWYEYFFAQRQQVREAVFTGLTPATGSRLEITITGTPAACAAVVVGNSLNIGCAQYGFSRGIIDYSRKETASDGTQRLKQGRYSRRISGTVVNSIDRLAATLRALEDVRATPCVWITAPDHGDLVEPLTVLGFYREFAQEVAGPTHTVCSFEIEGLSST